MEATCFYIALLEVSRFPFYPKKSSISCVQILTLLGRLHIFLVAIACFFSVLMVVSADIVTRALLVIPVILFFFSALVLYSHENSKALMRAYAKTQGPEARQNSSSAAQKAG